MHNQFNFKDFEPDFKLRLEANLVLDRTMDLAPYGAIGIGLMEKRGEGDYCCAFDIYSNRGPFMASAVGSSPNEALRCLEEKINKQLSWWKSRCGEAPPPSIVLGHPASIAS